MRKDIHRPSEINPEDYQYLGVYAMPIRECGSLASALDQRAAIDWMLADRELIRKFMEEHKSSFFSKDYGYSCDICGHVFGYQIAYYHKPSNKVILIGSDCARKVDMQDRALFEVKAGKVRKFNKMVKFVEENDLQTVIEFANSRNEFESNQVDTLKNMVSKLKFNGALTEKQVNFAKKLVEDIKANDERIKKYEAERKVEKAAFDKKVANGEVKEVPNGRITSNFTIIATKWVENDFGGALKMLAESKDGYKVWCTCTDKIAKGIQDKYIDKSDTTPRKNRIYRNPIKGDEFAMMVTLTQSKDDKFFGFGKRPTLK